MMRIIEVIVAGALCVACSSSEAGASGSGGAGGAGGQGALRRVTAIHHAAARCIDSVSGRVVDASGAGVPSLSVSVCGGICYYGESDANGAFTVSVAARLDPAAYSTLPHGRPNRTSFYFALPSAASGSVPVGDLLVLDLPATGPALVVKSDKAGAPAQTVSSGGVTLEVPDGVSVKIDVEDIELGDVGKMFRALRIPDAHMAAFADPALGLAALYQLTPFEAAMRDASNAPTEVRLSFDNVGLAAGTPVEILGLGSYLFPEWVPAGQFQVVATGAVSADGSRIEMDPGEGVGYLTWVGIREKS